MKIRRIFVKHQRVRTVFRRMFRRHRSSTAYHRLDPPPERRPEKSIFSLFSFVTNRLKTKAKAICSLGRRRREVVEEKPVAATAVPKGHLAVYVGHRDGDFKRVLVPVMYFNHPLFGELLREAENEFGFSHPGGVITIPCRISEFERVRIQINQVRGIRI